MGEFTPADHAMGLELQLEELHEQQERARVQGRLDDAERMQREIEALAAELATTAEMAAASGPEPVEPPQLQHAEELSAAS